MNKLFVKNKFNLLLCGLLFTLVSFFIACQKDLELGNSNIQSPPISVKSTSRNSNGQISLHDENRIAFSKIFVRALQKPELRDYFYTKYHALDLQDREFVYALYMDDVIDGLLLRDLLTSFMNNNDVSNLGSDFFIRISQNDPLLSIDFPDADLSRFEDWDVNTIPNILTLIEKPIHIGLISEAYPIYDFNGNMTGLDKNGDLTTVTLTIKTAETVYLVNPQNYQIFGGGNVLANLPGVSANGQPLNPPSIQIANIVSKTQIVIYNNIPTVALIVEYQSLLEEYNNLYPTPTPTFMPPPDCTSNCERDCKVADEVMTQFRLKNWAAYKFCANRDDGVSNNNEKWLTFQCIVTMFELPAIPVTRNLNFGTKKGKKYLNCKGTCTGIWQVVDQRIWKDWKLTEMKDRMSYFWFEVDNGVLNFSNAFTSGNKISFNVGGTSGTTSTGSTSGSSNGVTATMDLGTFTTTISGASKDLLPLSDDIVHYCDMANSPGTEYHAGQIIDFWVKHK